MDTELDLDKIALFDSSGVFLERSIVATNFIDGDTSGEGATPKNSLFVVDFEKFLTDLSISINAEVEDFGTNRDFFD